MTDVSISPVVLHDRDACVESGHAAPRMAHWLSLAAGPTFALMALWSAFACDQSDVLCVAMRGSLPISEMTTMYLLMSVFHSSPWLKAFFGQPNGPR